VKPTPTLREQVEDLVAMVAKQCGVKYHGKDACKGCDFEEGFVIDAILALVEEAEIDVVKKIFHAHDRGKEQERQRIGEAIKKNITTTPEGECVMLDDLVNIL